MNLNSSFLNYRDFYKVHGSPTLPPSGQCDALPPCLRFQLRQAARRSFQRKRARLPYRWGRRVKVITAFFICLTSSQIVFATPKITVPDLTPSSIEQLHAFSKSNPGAFTINVVPQQKWFATMTGFVTAPFTAFRNAFSLKNISLTLISGALSLGWISYLLCTYLIYKTYHVVKNAHSWTNWYSDDDLLSDYDALYRKIDYHKRSCASTKKPTLTLMTLHQEKELFAAYLRLDAFLRAHHLRHHFPHAGRTTHIQITSAYAKLQKAEELLTVRKRGLSLKHMDPDAQSLVRASYFAKAS